MKKLIPIILCTVFSIVVACTAQPPSEEQKLAAANQKLDAAGAPIFHGCGSPGQLLVTNQTEVFEGEKLQDLQIALNFDPVLRQAILDAMERQQAARKSKQPATRP